MPVQCDRRDQVKSLTVLLKDLIFSISGPAILNIKIHLKGVFKNTVYV